MTYDQAAYNHWDIKTSEGFSRLSHLEIHEEQLILLKEFLNESSTIVDLGCGTNLYKKYYPNLVGVDVIDHPNVDVHASILEYNTTTVFDAAMALGSIQYYDYDYIDSCFSKMVSLVKPSGYIFFRVLFTEKSQHYGHIIFWDYNMVNMFTERYNLDIIYPVTTYPLKDKAYRKFPTNISHLSNMTLVWRKK